ncbi:MAG: glycosyltransferase family 9 protein [Bacteroidales bacterium]|nr:glycosyltransferase family 9 protein [Bacteroidales bacterium]
MQTIFFKNILFSIYEVGLFLLKIKALYNSVLNRNSFINPLRVRKILVVKFYGIGNMVLFTPVLKRLRKKMPGVKIVLYTNSKALEVIKGTNYYDDAILLENTQKLKKFRAEYYRFINKIRQENFDMIFFSFPLEANWLIPILGITGSKYLIGYNTSDHKAYFTHYLEWDKQKHEVVLNFELLGLLISGPLTESLDLRLNKKEKNDAEKYMKTLNSSFEKIVVIHPGGSSAMPERRWPASNYIELIRKILDAYKCLVICIGSDDESELLKMLKNPFEENVRILENSFSLREIAAIIGKCNLFIGNDSGPMHLAAAVKTPVIALFGITNSQKSKPWGNHKKVIVINKGLACSPCYTFNDKVVCKEYSCIKSITILEVYRAVMLILK